MSRLDAKAGAQLIRVERLVAIIRPVTHHEALSSVSLLVEEGYRAIEISLSAECSTAALTEACRTWPDVSIGAGTVLSVVDAQRAVDAGAAFLVSPSLSPAVAEWALGQDLLHVPGVLTPSEVVQAREAGATLLKLFPAVTVQPSFVSQLLAPFPDVELVPTGGVDESNALTFLAAGAIALGVGTALTTDRSSARRFRALIPPLTED